MAISGNFPFLSLFPQNHFPKDINIIAIYPSLFDTNNKQHCVCAYSVTSVVSGSQQSYGLQPASLLCPWDSPGKNTGVGCRFLLQRSFPTLGSKTCLLCFLHQWRILTAETLGKLNKYFTTYYLLGTVSSRFCRLILTTGTFQVVQGLRICNSNAGNLGSIPGQGTRSHILQLRVCMPQLQKIPHAKAKTQHNQLNKYLKKLVDKNGCHVNIIQHGSSNT